MDEHKIYECMSTIINNKLKDIGFLLVICDIYTPNYYYVTYPSGAIEYLLKINNPCIMYKFNKKMKFELNKMEKIIELNNNILSKDDINEIFDILLTYIEEDKNDYILLFQENNHIVEKINSLANIMVEFGVIKSVDLEVDIVLKVLEQHLKSEIEYPILINKYKDGMII